jgi:hypothetical protein
MDDVPSGRGRGLALSSLNLVFWAYNLFVTITFCLI